MLDIGFRIELRNEPALAVHTDGVTFFPRVSRGGQLDDVPDGVVEPLPL